MKKENKMYAIYDSLDCGPTFGGGHDFYIANDSNLNYNSYSNFLHSFENNTVNVVYSTDAAKNYLAGAYNFRTKEIEVYHISKI